MSQTKPTHDRTDTKTTEEKLLDAFRTATHGWGAFTDRVDIRAHDTLTDDHVGSATFPKGGSVILNDGADVTTLDDILAGYGWEAGSIRVTPDGMKITVKEAQL